MTVANLTFDDRLTDAEYILVGAYLVVLGSLSIMFNIFVIIVLVKGNPKYHAVHNILLLNISVSDLLLSSVAYPLWASTNFYYRWIWPESVCAFSAFWCFTLAQNDMNTLAAIAICRYIIVCKPQYEYYLKKPNFKYWILVVVWSHSVMNTVPPFFGWSSYKQEVFGTSCSIDWTGKSASVISYNIVVTLTCYCVHLVIFCYCYTYIIRELTTLPSPPISEHIIPVERVRWYHRVSTSRAVTVTSLSMVGVFLIAWTPYTVVSIYSIWSNSLSTWMLLLPTLLAKSCTLLNPTVCALMSSKFRKAARMMFCKNKRIHPTVAMFAVPEIRNSTTSSCLRISGHEETIQYRGNLAQNDVFIGDMTITLPVDNNLV
ncbi:visual pigment-like receptor peropsin [Mytilus galloprovincialis]|uniref:Visual pigment-like receptor peropsin n=2 Tax=Mytilus galloprovincialis TaxID=29158 RepID=A0A8B6DYS1_MYTGA|nr:visual pigment-like receptor peropsin [Mytilus galloprovincialis]